MLYFSVHVVIKHKEGYISSASETRAFSRMKDCPKWINPGTRGCLIPKGVLLAGSTKRADANRINMVDIGYKGNPIQIYLPHAVYAQAMVYDDHTKLLTVVGGILFTDDPKIPNPCNQVWQLKLFVEGSKWRSRPDLPLGVYDPVLLSQKGTLYVLGGYTKRTEKLPDDDTDYDTDYDTYAEPNPEDGTMLCRALGIKDKEWQKMGLLKEPIDAPFGGAGVIHHGNILVITKKMAQKYERANNVWIAKDYDDITIYKCTPAVGPDGIVCAIAHYKRKPKDEAGTSKSTEHNVGTSKSTKHGVNKAKPLEEEVGIIKYDFADNTWTPIFPNFSLTNPSDLEVGAGKFLSLQLITKDLADVYFNQYTV